MKKTLYLILAVVLLSSCKIYDKYSRPDDITGENLYGTEVVENTDSATLATLSYKEIFTDPLLQDLIGRAIEQNADLKSLQYAVEQAQAGYKISKMAFVPGFNFVPQGGYNLPNTQLNTWSYSIPVAMDWEIDLFGKLLNKKRQAQMQLLATQDLQQAAQTQIVATVASLYYQLLMLDEQLVLTDSTAQNWRKTVQVMGLMKDAGMMNEVSVAQTEATCYAIEAGLLDLRKAIRNVENALCVILKQTPQPIVRGSFSEQSLPADLQVGVSAQLLSNRPDVRQSEHNLAAYFYGEQYARAQFYPSINISGSVLFSGMWIESLVGSLTQPIFRHYAVKGGLDIAKAQYKQALNEYEQKLISAGSEVNNALLTINTARQKQTQRTEQIQSLSQAMEHTQSLMTNGHTTYLEVIYAQQSLLDAQTSLLNDKLEEMQGIVTLYQALGGGVK